MASLIQQITQIDKRDFVQSDQVKESKRKTCQESNQTSDESGDAKEDHRCAVTEDDSVKPPMTPARRFLSKKYRREEKKSIRFDKSMIKTMRRQSNADMPGVVLASLVNRIDKAIHGSVEVEPSMTPQQAYAAFMGRVNQYQELESQIEQLSGKCGAKRRGTDVGDRNSPPKNNHSNINKLEVPFIQEAFAKLDIRIGGKNPDKERKTLLLKVADAMIADVELVANEARETMRRSAGYWRFANRRTYNAMVQNNQAVNWATGERLSDDSGDADDESDSVNTLNSETDSKDSPHRNMD